MTGGSVLIFLLLDWQSIIYSDFINMSMCIINEQHPPRWALLLFVLFGSSVVSESLATSWTAARQASLSFTISWRLLKLMSTDPWMPESWRLDPDEWAGWLEAPVVCPKAEATPVLPAPNSDMLWEMPTSAQEVFATSAADSTRSQVHMLFELAGFCSPRRSQVCPLNVQSAMARGGLWSPGRSVGQTSPSQSIYQRRGPRSRRRILCMCQAHPQNGHFPHTKRPKSHPARSQRPFLKVKNEPEWRTHCSGTLPSLRSELTIWGWWWWGMGRQWKWPELCVSRADIPPPHLPAYPFGSLSSHIISLLSSLVIFSRELGVGRGKEDKTHLSHCVEGTFGDGKKSPSGHEFEQTPGDSERQWRLACYSPWDPKESDMTERLNNNNKSLLPH